MSSTENNHPETNGTTTAETTAEEQVNGSEESDADKAAGEAADAVTEADRAAAESAEPADLAPATDAPTGPPADEKGSGARQGLAIAAALLLACGGLVGYGLLDSDEQQPKQRAVPTAEVTYEVTGEGTVEISYLARSESGTATVEKGVTLPWQKTVQVPVGNNPVVAVTLDGKGGQAACTLAIRGKHVQRATATGEFGRATCTGELPAPER
ncbi:hypothetical protein ACLB9X_07555 [Streptomyces sp. 5K101]|uniref:hypothetical protein n=1 Tax=Streptomyces sp. 5K101 TaxID=3390037 RepID=UPI003976EF75